MLKKKFIKGFGWTFILQKVGFGIKFFGGVVLARILLPEDFGQLALLTSIVVLVFVLKGVGFDTYAVQCSSHNFKEYVGTAFAISLCANLAVTLMALVVALIVTSGTVMFIFLTLLFTYSFSEITFIYRAVLRRELFYKKIASLELISLVLSVGVGIILAIQGFGVWSLVFMVLVEKLCRIILSIYWTPYFVKPCFSREGARNLMNFGKYNFLADAAGKLYGQGDKVILGRVEGSSVLGFYGRARSLVEVGSRLFFMSLSSVIGPLFSKLKSAHQKLSSAYNRLLAITFRVNVGLYLILSCIVTDFVLIFYTEKWLPAVPIFKAILPFAIISPMLGVTRRMYLNIGQPRPVAIAHIILVLSLVVAVVPFIFLFDLGGVGLALSLDVSVFCAFLFLLCKANRFISVKFRKIFLNPSLVALTGVILYVLIKHWPVVDNIWARLFLRGAVAGIFYLIGLFILERRYIIDLLREVKSNVLKHG